MSAFARQTRKGIGMQNTQCRIPTCLYSQNATLFFDKLRPLPKRLPITKLQKLVVWNVFLWVGEVMSYICQGFDTNLFRIPVNHQEKICISWVQTRGYPALRILHADTPTRLFSGSAYEMQTFLDNLRNPKKHHRTLHKYSLYKTLNLCYSVSYERYS